MVKAVRTCALVFVCIVVGAALAQMHGEGDDQGWRTIVPYNAPDVCRLMDEHLSRTGNWVGIQTQISDDCGIRFIVEFGSGPPPEADEEPAGPQPTPASGIDPTHIGGAY
jgi:hypothetical protein